jgi:hypothetical protein
MLLRKLKRKPLDESDEAKEQKLNAKLTKLSVKLRKEELKNKATTLKIKAKKRAYPNDPSSPDYNPNLNKSGNKTGLAIRDNPRPKEYYQKIGAMRKFYSRQTPVLQCSSCSLAQSCPQFKAGYECAFLPLLNSHKVETVDDLLNYMKNLIEANMRRSHLAMIMETLSGAQPSIELGESLNLAFQQLSALHDKLSDSTEIELETNDSSIISRLFGGLGNLAADTEKAIENPIEVPTDLLLDADAPPAKELLPLPPSQDTPEPAPQVISRK